MTKAVNQLDPVEDAHAEQEPASAVANRRPYTPPSVRTGEAFEHVMLESGCNTTLFCSVPC